MKRTPRRSRSRDRFARIALRRAILFFVAVSLAASTALAQTPARKSAAELGLEPHWIEGPAAFPGLPEAIHAYRQARNEIRVLHVGAHPDDEHSGMMAWLARTKGYRVAYLSATRGEGGQNSIGPETGELLGALRTEELLAARRIDGGEQRFLDLPDFGFSKTSEETLRIWDRERALRLLVGEIRNFEPQYIVSVFLGDPTDGHGHHQAMGLLCREAFEKAADPTFAANGRDDLGVGKAWRADALLASRWRFDANADAETVRSINLGVHDPVYGLSPWQIAARGRSMHRSQDMGMLQPYGPQSMQLQLLDLADGVEAESVWSAFAETTPVVELPDRDALLALWDKYALDPESHRDGLQRVQRALWELDGPMVELLSPKLEVVQGQELELTLRVAATKSPVVVRKVELLQSTPTGIRMTVDEWGSMTVYEPSLTELSEWSGRNIALGTIESADATAMIGPPNNGRAAERPRPVAFARLLIAPEDGARNRHRAYAIDPSPNPRLVESFPPSVLVEYAAGDEQSLALRCAAPAVRVQLNPRLGERRSPAQSAPSVSFNVAPKLLVAPMEGEAERELTIGAEVLGDLAPSIVVGLWQERQTPRIRFEAVTPSAYMGQLDERAERGIGLALGDLAHPRRAIVTIGDARTKEQVAWDASISALVPGVPGTDADEDLIKAYEEGKRWRISPLSRNLARIDYEHIPVRLITRPSAFRVVRVDAKLPPDLRVAYYVDRDDGMPAVLRQLGADVTEIPRDQLATADWSAFDTVMLGQRAYELTPELVAANARLMDWVREGGALVVQYNKYPMEKLGVAPCEFHFSRPHDRVTDETAAVEFLQPDSAILNYPNKIGVADFDGWNQERSLYGFGSFDEAEYVPILAAADPGEEPQRGMLLEARVGKGRWVYCALALHRQAPEGVPGGIRLLANLASLGRWTREHPTDAE